MVELSAEAQQLYAELEKKLVRRQAHVKKTGFLPAGELSGPRLLALANQIGRAERDRALTLVRESREAS